MTDLELTEDEMECSSDKLFAWIISMIDIQSVDYRRNYVPLWDLIKTACREDTAMIRSDYYLDDYCYEFKISLEKNPYTKDTMNP